MLKKLVTTLLGSAILITGSSLPVLANESESFEQLETNASSLEMHRLYNPNSSEHFYTKDSHEKDVLVSLGWKYEGIGWYAPLSSSIPVYRLYNKNSQDHHYTTDQNEKNTLVGIGWIDEGIGWYSDDSKTVPLYRVYNPNTKVAGSHHYTTDQNERNSLVSSGWKNEGIAWYALKEGSTTSVDSNQATSLNLKGNYVRASGVGKWADELTINENNHIRGTYHDAEAHSIVYYGYSGDLTNITLKRDYKYSATITNTKNEIPLLDIDINYYQEWKDLKSKSFEDGDSITIYLPGYSTENLESTDEALKLYLRFHPNNGPVLKEVFISSNKYLDGYCANSYTPLVASQAQIIQYLTTAKHNGQWGYMGAVGLHTQDNMCIQTMKFTDTNVSIEIAGLGYRNLDLGTYSYEVIPRGEAEHKSIFLLIIHDVHYDNKVSDLIFQVGLYRGGDLDPSQKVGYSSSNFVALKNEVFSTSPYISKFNLVS